MNPQIYSELAKQVFQLRLKPLLETQKDKVWVIGIDGPTAAGKTILADLVAEEIRSTLHRPAWTYRLDWNLADRAKRVRDLEHLSKQSVPFPLEGELHMRLDLFQDFLKTVRVYNEERERGKGDAVKKVALKNLYSREKSGTLQGEAEFGLAPGTVILAEGHYTLRTALAQFIDCNILLLGDAKELLARKVARVQDYRGAEAAKDYFWRVDLPSFCHHLKRFGLHADWVIDNTRLQNPEIKTTEFIADWLEQNRSPLGAGRAVPSLDLQGIVDRVLSPSLMVSEDLRKALRETLNFVLEWDRHVGKFLRESVQDIGSDLTSLSERMIAELKSCSIQHTNALYNVYNRSLPISIGIAIAGESKISVLVDCFHDFLRLQIAWAGGYSRFQIRRKLGDIANEDHYVVSEDEPSVQPAAVQTASATVRVITPTLFTLPSFLRDFAITEVFSGLEEENISASQALVELADRGGVWIHRFAKFSEMNYFAEILTAAGGQAVKAGNYLIAVWSKDRQLNQQFKKFREAWAKPLFKLEEYDQDEAALDRIIDEERSEIERFVAQHCPDFSVLDGFLHCAKIGHDPEVWRRIVRQLAQMLLSPSRIVRKRTVQFIQKYFPELSLEVRKIWADVPPAARSHISLDALTSISPSILGEIYLWLALRDDRSAILGANIYDIRKRSIDCLAYLRAAAAMQTAIVLQGSLNALGPGQGYLKPKAAAADLVEAALNAARDMLLVSGKMPPLFGIGLDHVDAGNDQPPGRAKRFLEEAMATEQVTHYVLDGSALFAAEQHTPEALRESFQRMTQFAVNLLEGKVHAYIFDKEVCAGELNYFGKTKQALIPSEMEMEQFVQIFLQKMREAGLGLHNTRPMLLVGNLGTTHHGFDSGEIAVAQAKVWRDQVKKSNFVSAVLHGTTGTHPHVLAEAAAGCHKINVAGDFLNTLIQSLPQRLREIVLQEGSKPNGSEPKQRLFLIREGMDAMAAPEETTLRDSLQAHCRQVLDTIHAPQLSAMDINYFRYKNYKFTPRQVEVICEELLRQTETFSPKELEKPADPRLSRLFSASMIEVPFDNHYKELTRVLWQEGVSRFHVDVGDGKLIPRAFSGLEKLQYLRKTFPQAVIHCHLMVENANFPTANGPSFIEQYAKAGCNAIAIHRRAFSKERFFLAGLEAIRELGARPGIVIETSEILDSDLENLLLEKNIDWVVVMGVPVGFGGQIFDMSTLKRIAWFHQFAVTMKKPLLIEVDGGLTLENISLCKRSGAQIFSGWSIVKADTLAGVKQKFVQIQKLIA